MHAASLLVPGANVTADCVVDLSIIGFFYLLRPGEYCTSSTDINAPIRLQDIELLFGQQIVSPLTSPIDLIRRVTHSSITFPIQKNRERGETIGHGRTGNLFVCPTQALIQRIIYLRSNNAPPTTPISAILADGLWQQVSSSQLTKTLQFSARIAPHLGIAWRTVSVRGLRAGGAMALLCA